MRRICGTHPLGNWGTNPPKHYPRFSSGPYRGMYVHRVMWELVSGRPVPAGFQIHHQDWDKFNIAPENLICLPAELHEPRQLRCPYTGRFLSPDEYRVRLGIAA
jgi:hypothetical protein